MVELKSFSPEHLIEDAKRSGFFQCRKCGLVWFGGKPHANTMCPQGPHGRPVHVAVICRSCDAVVPVVPVDRLESHFSEPDHVLTMRVS